MTEKTTNIPTSFFHVVKQVFLFYFLPFLGLALIFFLLEKVEAIFGIHEDATKIIRFLLMGLYAVIIFLTIRKKNENDE